MQNGENMTLSITNKSSNGKEHYQMQK